MLLWAVVYWSVSHGKALFTEEHGFFSEMSYLAYQHLKKGVMQIYFYLFWASHLTHMVIWVTWIVISLHPSSIWCVRKLQSTPKPLDQAWKDGPWEEEIQIWTKEIDPSWGGTIRGLKRGNYVNIVPWKVVFCKHDLH